MRRHHALAITYRLIRNICSGERSPLDRDFRGRTVDIAQVV